LQFSERALALGAEGVGLGCIQRTLALDEEGVGLAVREFAAGQLLQEVRVARPRNEAARDCSDDDNSNSLLACELEMGQSSGTSRCAEQHEHCKILHPRIRSIDPRNECLVPINGMGPQQ
jgi:hypothetical protein